MTNHHLSLERALENRNLTKTKQILIVLLNIGVITAAGILAGCSCTGPSNLEKGQPMERRTIEKVQEEHTGKWMAIPGVEGTAIGLFKGKPCIRIFTSSSSREVRAKIPSTVEGYPIIIEETGAFRALDQE
ncbi:MAG: hypothetical protein WAV28_06880 [Sedimentisphaerales bacterium]